MRESVNTPAEATVRHVREIDRLLGEVCRRKVSDEFLGTVVLATAIERLARAVEDLCGRSA